MKEKIKCFIEEYFIEIILAIILVVLTYGYEITNWTMTIDEEIHSNINRYTSFVGWSSQGRWGIGLLKLILPTYRVLPFWSGFVAILLLVFSSFSICKITDWFKVGITGHCIALIVYLCSPVHSFYLMFDTYSVEVSLGILLALISGYKIVNYFCFTHNKLDLGIGIFCLIYAIGIYQLLLQIYVCVVCAGLLAYTYYNEVKMRKFMSIIAKTVCILFFAVIIYAVIDSLIQNFFLVNDNYIDSFIRWGEFDFKMVLGFVLEQLCTIYLHPGKLYTGGEVLLLAYVFLIISLLVMIVRKKCCVIELLMSGLGMLIALSLGVIFLGGPTPLRTHQTIPIFMSIVMAIGTKFLSELCHKDVVKTIIFAVIFVVFMNQSARVVDLFYSENNRQNRDLFLTNNIATEIQKLDLGYCPDYPVVFIGYPEILETNLIQEELFSHSMLASGEMRRTYIWFALHGYDYIQPTEEEREKAEKIAEDNPTWPHNGSVFFEDGLIIVKFEEM